jgi:hypothetical protein
MAQGGDLWVHRVCRGRRGGEWGTASEQTSQSLVKALGEGTGGASAGQKSWYRCNPLCAPDNCTRLHSQRQSHAAPGSTGTSPSPCPTPSSPPACTPQQATLRPCPVTPAPRNSRTAPGHHHSNHLGPPCRDRRPLPLRRDRHRPLGPLPLRPRLSLRRRTRPRRCRIRRRHPLPRS